MHTLTIMTYDHEAVDVDALCLSECIRSSCSFKQTDKNKKNAQPKMVI